MAGIAHTAGRAVGGGERAWEDLVRRYSGLLRSVAADYRLWVPDSKPMYEANVEGTREILVEAVTDPGRSLRERQTAAHSLQILKDGPDAAELVRLYEEAPEEVRPLVMASFGRAGPSRRIDDILIESAVAVGDRRLRSNATLAIGFRIVNLPKSDARDLGERTAMLVRSAGPESSAEMLKYLGLAAMQDGPVRDAVRELSRTAPTGGAVQVAIAANPALRTAAGL